MEQQCESCHLWKRPPFIEIYADLYANRRAYGSLRIDKVQRVCANCLVGKFIPAYRPRTSQWTFGQVVAYEDPHFALLFRDSTHPEWLRLETRPLEAYMAQFRAKTYDNKSIEASDDEAGTVGRGISSQQRVSMLSPYDQHWRHSVHLHLPTSPIRANKEYHTIREPEGSLRIGDAVSLNHDLGSGVIRSVPKSSPRLWTSEVRVTLNPQITSCQMRIDTLTFVCDRCFAQEDQLLIRAVQKVKDQSASVSTIKWPDVAKLVPHRTGKQCRERYFNHLVPTVVSAEWTPIEDFIVFRVYKQLGSKWALISKLLPGRTDNNVKNRFHYLRRQLEKQTSSSLAFIGSTGGSVVDASLKDQIMKASESKCAHDELTEMVVASTIQMLSTTQNTASQADSGAPLYLGPFKTPVSGSVLCARCGLMVPSSQTGDSVCERTGWCSSCTLTCVYLSDDLLRVVHRLRITGEEAKAKRVSIGTD